VVERGALFDGHCRMGVEAWEQAGQAEGDPGILVDSE